MFTIKVVSKSSGKPASGRRVSVGFDGLLRGHTKDQRTDPQGEAHFDSDPGSGTVYVDGSSAHKGRIEGRVVVYV